MFLAGEIESEIYFRTGRLPFLQLSEQALKKYNKQTHSARSRRTSHRELDARRLVRRVIKASLNAWQFAIFLRCVADFFFAFPSRDETFMALPRRIIFFSSYSRLN
jgi:hypothetical protein